jgi:hypothetical protein
MQERNSSFHLKVAVTRVTLPNCLLTLTSKLIHLFLYCS